MKYLNAPIIPGKSAAGCQIGMKVPSEIMKSCTSIEDLSNNVQKLNFGEISIWLKNGIVDQIGIYIGYSGKIDNRIGIGSTIQEIIDELGEMVEDIEDNLDVVRIPGLCFETETWEGNETIDDNRDKKVTEIYVFDIGIQQFGFNAK